MNTDKWYWRFVQCFIFPAIFWILIEWKCAAEKGWVNFELLFRPILQQSSQLERARSVNNNKQYKNKNNYLVITIHGCRLDLQRRCANFRIDFQNLKKNSNWIFVKVVRSQVGSATQWKNIYKKAGCASSRPPPLIFF